jgi:hypothetical protein
MHLRIIYIAAPDMNNVKTAIFLECDNMYAGRYVLTLHKYLLPPSSEQMITFLCNINTYYQTAQCHSPEVGNLQSSPGKL